MIIIATDDERRALELLEEKITSTVADATVMGFTSADNALAYARTANVDIAFLDIKMPEMSGVELAKRLKDINPRTNIIFVTGYSEYKGDAMDLRASGYLMKPVSKEAVERELENLRHPIERKSGKRIRVQTFGNFEVFADGRPILFKYEKTKQLLAYLVHRRGAVLNNREIIAAIWDDADEKDTLKGYFRILVHDLTNTLKKLGLPNIVVKKYGHTGLITDEISCDYYDYLEGIPNALNSYRKEYMAQYSWGEPVNALLSDSK